MAHNWPLNVISTHTPHAGRDFLRHLTGMVLSNFNSHAPCGARLSVAAYPPTNRAFQLTRPMRGATGLDFWATTRMSISTHTPHAGRDNIPCKTFPQRLYFNSHAPCGARLQRSYRQRTFSHFNSHAPCGARQRRDFPRIDGMEFQLTRPMRGATCRPAKQKLKRWISTHTPHAGRDQNQSSRFLLWGISTHTPHAGRDIIAYL